MGAACFPIFCLKNRLFNNPSKLSVNQGNNRADVDCCLAPHRHN